LRTMVYVSDRKFACESCIKGHRSSSCHHSDRPLFEIKRKGRPVSQCDKCRELRHSKKVHTKCICNPKFDLSLQRVPLASNGTKSKRYMPIAPALPNGLKDLTQGSSKQLVDLASTPNGSPSPDVPPNPRPSLDTLATAAAMCCSSTPVAQRTGHQLHTTPGPQLPPIQDASTSLRLPAVNFPVIPPLKTIASLAGSGCTCGLQCACPGCVEHRGVEHASPTRKNCADGCGTCVDERLVPLPGLGHSQNITSIVDRFLAHAAALPAPPRRKSTGVQLDPTDITVYPNSVWESKESAVAFGLVSLPKLECCGGTCGCPDNQCNCGNACDGCC